MDFVYTPLSEPDRKLLVEGHQHPEMVATLAELAASGVPPRARDRDGDREDIGGLAVTHRFVEAPGECETVGWHYVEAGAGEPLVLLHGIPQSWHMWAPVLPELAKHFRCIAIDLKGYGQSHKGRGDFRHEGAAMQMLALLDTIGVGRFALFSHDRGTMQADYMVAADPARITRWIRGSQHFVRFHPDLAPQEHLFTGLETRGVLQDPLRLMTYMFGRLCKYPLPREQVVRAIQEWRPGTGLAVERYFQSSTFRKDWIERCTRLIPRWTCPTLMLQGSEEPPMPKANYIGVEHHLPNGRIDFVDAGHFYIEENPAGTLAAALPFLTAR
ncbi:MAG: alpha/beta fold hydrolase [Alphaproteobacteria bacterium]